MDAILHWFAHLFRLNLHEGAVGKVDGHLYWGVRCLTCERWKPKTHSSWCECDWASHLPSAKKRQR